MQKNQIKAMMEKYFETPEINNKIRNYLKQNNLTYENIENDELIKMLQTLSLLDPLLNKLEDIQSQRINVSPYKKNLVLKIQKGRAFVNMMDYPKDTKFVISVCFLNQRYQTTPIAVNQDPFIGQTIQMSFDRKQLNIQQLKNIQLAISILNSNGTRTIYSVKQFQWRFVLAFGSISFDVELAPYKHTGVTELPCVGILSVVLELYPKSKAQLISQRLLNSQLALQKKQKQSKVMSFYQYANNFWNDFKSIHSSFGKRSVKLYGESQDKLFVPMSKFIYPLYNIRGIDSPFHALRFVSIIPFQKQQLNNKPIYKRFHTFLSSGSGNVQDHCHLLCSLLLGFGINSYVCSGYSIKGQHKWVMTEQKGYFIFWETTTGTKSESQSQKAQKFYKTINYVYNHSCYYANIQLNDSIVSTSLKLVDQNKWKAVDPKLIQNAPLFNQQISLLFPTLNGFKIQVDVEQALIKKIDAYRKEFNLGTKFDQKMSSFLSMVLANYQYERITENTFGEKEFQTSIKNYIAEKHTFKAFPIQLFEKNPEVIFNILKSNKTSNQILLTRGDSVFFAIKTKLISYPDNFFVLWLSLAVRFYKLI